MGVPFVFVIIVQIVELHFILDKLWIGSRRLVYILFVAVDIFFGESPPTHPHGLRHTTIIKISTTINQIKSDVLPTDQPRWSDKWPNDSESHDPLSIRPDE